MLMAQNVRKVFNGGMEVEVLSGVDLTVYPGDFMVITGKSGSGKSTLLYLLSGLEKPTEGAIYYGDLCINNLKDKEMSKIRRTKFGFIFQFYNLIPTLTVKDNIFLPVEFGNKITKERKDKIETYIEILGLSEKIHAHPYQLSGGQQQRVAIARALAIEPEIIFADEPTGNLDMKTSEGVMEIFQTLNSKEKQTIVLVTHDNTIGKRYATREITVENGNVLE